MGPLLFLCQVLDLFREKRSFPKIFYLYLDCQNLREDFRLEGRFSLPRSERINPTMDKFLIPSRFSGVLQGLSGLAGVFYCWAMLELVECPLLSWSLWIRS